MSDLQSKLGEGLSKIQGGIEQGKHKLHTTQEVSKLKKQLSHVSNQKSKVLAEMGLRTHHLVRTGQFSDASLQQMTQSLVELDQTTYHIHQQLEALTQTKDTSMTCECGATVQQNDNFCGECGRKVETSVDQEEQEMMPCTHCEERVPHTAHFCHCCGHPLAS